MFSNMEGDTGRPCMNREPKELRNGLDWALGEEKTKHYEDVVVVIILI
jgi:hypothetical protein